MTTLEALASRVDVYSIDEAFLDLTGIDRVVSFEPFGRQAIWLKVESPDGYETRSMNNGIRRRLALMKASAPLRPISETLMTNLEKSQLILFVYTVSNAMLISTSKIVGKTVVVRVRHCVVGDLFFVLKN